MINLLSPENKRQLRAARQNVVLARYYLFVFLTVALLASVFAVGLVVTSDEKAQAESARANSDSIASQYAPTRKAAEEFSKDLEVAKTILANDVPFSQLITDIAAVIPPGVILNNLALTTATQQNSPITINARAKNYDDAIKLKNSLEQSPIFENVSLVSVSNSTGSENVGQYPVSVNLSVQFSRQAGGSQT